METALLDNVITDNGRMALIGGWLDRKADTPEELAEFCYEVGARGLPKCPTACVIASLVERTFGVRVVATQFGIRLRDSASFRKHVPSPVVAQFITNFDKGMYPELTGEYEGDPFSGNTTH